MCQKQKKPSTCVLVAKEIKQQRRFACLPKDKFVTVDGAFLREGSPKVPLKTK